MHWEKSHGVCKSQDFFPCFLACLKVTEGTEPSLLSLTEESAGPVLA
jgi:hypothetical protein